MGSSARTTPSSELHALRISLDALSERSSADPQALGDAETVVELERLAAQLQAITVRTVAAFEATRLWSEVDQARSLATWLAVRCRLPKSEASRQVRIGRAIRYLPAFDAAWGRGEITIDHVDAVQKIRRFETEQYLERDEPMLVDQANTLNFAHFTKAVQYWEQQADPNGSEWDAEMQRQRRDVWLTPSLDGMYLGSITLDPISGAIVSGELERIEKEFFEADWSEARERLGQDPIPAQLRRSFAQRRADALVEMASRSATAPADGRRPDPLFTVLVNYETLHGRIVELAQGAALTPGSLIPWLDAAMVERVVFGLGARVEVSQRARLFTGGTRRALEVRDRGCTHPFCDEQVQRCQVDHIDPFAEGGLTVQDNGRILCGFHNRLRNKDGKGKNKAPPEDDPDDDPDDLIA